MMHDFDQQLVRMANSIGDFFVAMPDAQEAEQDLAEHIRRFWAPRMRRGILEHIDRTGGTDLQPLVLQALRSHRQQLL